MVTTAVQSEEVKDKNSRLRGKVEGLTGRYLKGWMWDEGTPEAQLAFDVYIDGQVVASDIAGDFRDDLAKASIGSGGHAFAVLLPGSLFDGNRHDIIVKESVTGRKLAPLKNAYFNSDLCPEYIAKVEPIEKGIIRGYIYNARDLSAKIAVALIAGGHEICVVMADRPSPGNPATACAFEIDIAEFDLISLVGDDVCLVSLPDRYVLMSHIDVAAKIAHLSTQLVHDLLLLTVDLNIVPRNGTIFDVLVNGILQMQISCSSLNPSSRLVGHLPVADFADGFHSISVRFSGTQREIDGSPLSFGRQPNLVKNSYFEHWTGTRPDSWILSLPKGVVVEPSYAVKNDAVQTFASTSALAISASTPTSLTNTIIAQDISIQSINAVDVVISAMADERTLIGICVISNPPASDNTTSEISKNEIKHFVTVWRQWATKRLTLTLPNDTEGGTIRLSFVIVNAHGTRVYLRTIAAGAHGFEYENEARFEILPTTNAVSNGDMAYWEGSLRKQAQVPEIALAEGWTLSCKKPDAGVEARLTEIITRDPKRGLEGLLAHAIALSGTITNRYIRLETQLETTQLAAAPPSRLEFYAKSGINPRSVASAQSPTTMIAEIMVIERRGLRLSGATKEEAKFTDERVCSIASRINIRSHGETFVIDLKNEVSLMLQQRAYANTNRQDVKYLLTFQFSNYVEIAITNVRFGKSGVEEAVYARQGFLQIEDHNITAQINRLKGLSHWNEMKAISAPSWTASAIPESLKACTKWSWMNTQNKSVDIVICVHNALDETLDCLRSIVRFTDIPYTVTIVNDASDLLVGERLHLFTRDLPWMRILDTASNIGYTRAANMGLSSSNAEWIVLLNSDTIVTPNWLQGLFEVVEARPDVAMVGPLSNAASWQTVPDLHDLKNRWKVNAIPEHLTINQVASFVSELSQRRFPSVGLLNGFCTLMKRSVVEEVGFLDEKAFPQGYGEENDLCVRVIQAGYSLAIADHVYVYHVKSASFGRERRDVLSKQGTASFMSKHPDVDLSEITRALAEETTLTEMRSKLRRRLADHAQNLPSSCSKDAL